MATELKIPEVGESITEVVIGEWLVSEGDEVSQDDNLVIIETDKVNVELPAPEAGTIKEILKGDGEEAEVGEVIGYLEPGGGGKKKKAEKKDDGPADEDEETTEPEEETEDKTETGEEDTERKEPGVMPAAKRLLAENDLDASEIEGTGRGGRILKEDVQRYLDSQGDEKAPKKAEEPKREDKGAAEKEDEPKKPKSPAEAPAGAREEEAVRMTPLRRRVAERLLEAQHNAALLTTFNEIDMSKVMALRKTHQEAFVERHGIKLGFMSFFVKASIEALKEFPRVNAEIRGEEIVYRNYYDVGVAVGGGKGLVVPVIRNAERLSFAEVEKTIADLATRAKDGKLSLDELQGGTFTLSNGGIYGSLLSTPIINPPQSGILGMHKIEERPIALDGEVVIRPMMYVALTYDHRIVDGREAVSFLVRIKEAIEDPTRILLEV